MNTKSPLPLPETESQRLAMMIRLRAAQAQLPLVDGRAEQIAATAEPHLARLDSLRPSLDLEEVQDFEAGLLEMSARYGDPA